MGTRTANGTGNIRKRPNGTWEVRLSYVDGDGTLKRVSVYGKTQREVRDKMKPSVTVSTTAHPSQTTRWRSPRGCNGGVKPPWQPRIARSQPGRCTRR